MFKRIYEYLTVALFSFIGGIYFWEQTQKPNSVTNIENNTKIKNNKAPISDVEVKTEVQPEIKKERRKWIKNVFKRKNK